jgi:predicted RNA-binding protein YlxR (DUF448 family)
MTATDDRAPIRTCVGCRAKRPQAELVRCVLAADGCAHVDRYAPGRGAWLCGSRCLDAALRRRGFERAWRLDARLPADAFAPLGSELPGTI